MLNSLGFVFFGVSAGIKRFWRVFIIKIEGHLRKSKGNIGTQAFFSLEHLEEGEVREIKHTQYTSWPDHGVPDHPTPFLMFLKRVKALNPHNAGPIVTHCSAGVGRTGAFIVVDCMVERIYAENTVDVYGCVRALRSQRMYMVQTDEQYVFIHEAVLDAAQSGSTEVPANKFPQHVDTHIQAVIQGQSTGLDLEYQSLIALQPPNVHCSAAQLPCNLDKNRSALQLPYDANRVQLQRIHELDGSDYINASWIDSYTRRNAYIAAQAPMSHTTIDFWRMLWETDACVVVMLTGQPEFLTQAQRDKYAEYWPQSRLKYDFLCVEHVLRVPMSTYVLQEFRVVDERVSGFVYTCAVVNFFNFTKMGLS